MSNENIREYYFSYSLTSQTLIFKGRTPEKNYRYTYMAFFTEDKTGKDFDRWKLKAFGNISNITLNDIFECKEVSNIEVSKDNISKLYTLRFCSPQDLYRRYTGKLKYDSEKKVFSAEKISSED